MPESPTNPEAAFHVSSEGDGYALHLRCCDVHVKLDANHEAINEAINEAIARHLSRVHGYIATVDDDISLEDLRRRLPTKPTQT